MILDDDLSLSLPFTSLDNIIHLLTPMKMIETVAALVNISKSIQNKAPRENR
jgi:hypothetical protein